MRFPLAAAFVLLTLAFAPPVFADEPADAPSFTAEQVEEAAKEIGRAHV
jgi:hypothetical protein